MNTEPNNLKPSVIIRSVVAAICNGAILFVGAALLIAGNYELGGFALGACFVGAINMMIRNE